MGKRGVIQSVNPATEEVMKTYEAASEEVIEEALDEVTRRFQVWRNKKLSERSQFLSQAASYLRTHQTRFAQTMTAEMGKPIQEAESEIEKCAWNCEYYAENAEKFLARESRDSNASESYVQFAPLGPVLAIMPWNFPLWQLIRFAAPAFMAGNTALLKHAENVPQCASGDRKSESRPHRVGPVWRIRAVKGRRRPASLW